MEKIDKLPFYDNYMLLVEEKNVAEKEIIELENPEKQLERIKKFYQNIGADYKKNQWLLETEENLSFTNRDEDSRMSQLKRTVKLGTIIENAVVKQDDESLRTLSAYGNSEMYSNLVRQIMFYVGVCKAKDDPEFIQKAGIAIMKRYPPIEATLFINEGVHYYIFYLHCLQSCLKRYKKHSMYGEVKEKAAERCMNLKLMLNPYREDIYIEDKVKSILTEISDLEGYMAADAETIIE